MLRAYKKRPETFKIRILEYINGSLNDLRVAEQRWLDMIKDSELYWTTNIYNKTVKYYNQKKQSAGGNGNANKGKIRSEETRKKMSESLKGKIPWNKGIPGQPNSNAFSWKVVAPDGRVFITNTLDQFCRNMGISKTSLYYSFRKSKPSGGKHPGWQLFKIG